MRRRSRRSARRSITSPHTPEQPRGNGLRQLIEALPPERRRTVFAHSSWVAERGHSYERLEFLGDSVLGLAITRHLYERFPDRSEGELARMRAHVVSRASCAAVGRELGLDHDRRFTSVALVEGAELGRGSGGSKKASEQEAAREALEEIARAGM